MSQRNVPGPGRAEFVQELPVHGAILHQPSDIRGFLQVRGWNVCSRGPVQDSVRGLPQLRRPLHQGDSVLQHPVHLQGKQG